VNAVTAVLDLNAFVEAPIEALVGHTDVTFSLMIQNKKWLVRSRKFPCVLVMAYVMRPL
jgi:hypothetical protein